MFTGRYPHETSANWQSALDTTHPTLAEFLRSHGYLTAGFTANEVYTGYEYGLNRGFIRYEDFPISLKEIMVNSSLGKFLSNSAVLRRLWGRPEILGRKTASDVNRDFLEWLPAERSRPFFVFLNYFDAHEPYLPPSPYDLAFGPERRQGNQSFMNLSRNAFRIDKWAMSAHEARAERNAYEGAIAYIDDNVGQLLGVLEKRGLLDNTLVIITSDHGEQLGEHGLFDHGNSLYLPLIHVPLLISFPGRITADFAVSEPVTLRDLPATVVDLVGLKNSSPFPGISLRRYWDRSGYVDGARESPLLSELSPGFPRPAFYPVSKGEMKSLVVGRYHYVKNGDGGEELYDFIADPSEINNLAISGNMNHVLDTTRSSLTRVFERPAS
jgi:arylsulfatase A-like enzyme